MNCHNCIHYNACYACDHDYTEMGIKSKAENKCESFDLKDVYHKSKLKLGATVYCIVDMPPKKQNYNPQDGAAVKTVIEHKVCQIIFRESGATYMCKGYCFKEDDIGKSVYTNKDKARKKANGWT